ncbi:MAG: hypothetical protein ACYTGW_19185 [Planctomycetota bacterium]|jgi:hypothetical protein
MKILPGALAVVATLLLGSAPVASQGGGPGPGPGKKEPGKQEPGKKDAEKKDADAAKPVDLDTQLAALKKLANTRKGESDRQAIETLDRLVRRYTDLNKNGQRRLAAAVGKILTDARPKRSPKSAQLFERCIAAVGQMGKLGSKPLQEAYENKKFHGKQRKEWVPLRAGMLVALGSTKDPAAIPFLLKKAEGDNYDQLKGAAGGALGEFVGVSKKERRKICARLIHTLVTSQAQSRNLEIGAIERDGYRRRFEATRVPWTRTLQKLTGRGETDPVKWQRLLNKKKLFRESSRKRRKR